jgi:hypothetical protein
MSNLDSLATSPAFWQGLMQPLLAKSEDPSDHEVARDIMRQQPKLAPIERVSFMVGWHTMLNKQERLDIKWPKKPKTARPKPAAKNASPPAQKSPAPTAAKAPSAVVQPVAARPTENGKGGEVKAARRPHLSDLHSEVRGFLSQYGIMVDKPPRAPCRRGDTVTYYFADPDIVMDDDEAHKVAAELRTTLGKRAEEAKLVLDSEGRPFRADVHLYGLN